MSSFVANEGRGYLPQSAAIPDMVAETQVRSAHSATVHSAANSTAEQTPPSQASFSVLQS